MESGFDEVKNSIAIKWPYPIKYEEEKEISTDVLVIGGGIAGCWAAIEAVKNNVDVTIVEKTATERSGSGGAGVDHWQLTCTNPCCKVDPEEVTKASLESYGGYDLGIKRYIQCKDSYDTLLELEKMGVKIRDTEDEFKGADFRDEETKFLFAYDYENKYTNRVWGDNVKPVLKKECDRLGIEIIDRVMVTALLTEKGKQGSRVVGATGVNTRTGEFYIFKSKATLLCAADPGSRPWVLSTEKRGLAGASPEWDPNNTGDGSVMAWKAGAEFSMMEKTRAEPGPFGYPSYGVGNPENTWLPCSIVDSQGKEVPWVDKDGKLLKSVSERSRPAPGQKFILRGGGAVQEKLSVEGEVSELTDNYPVLTPDLPERIENGEFVPPFYADLPAMPEHERNVIFGLMVGNEGKTWILYRNLTKAGFDPNKDMLQVPNFPIVDAYRQRVFWAGMSPPHFRATGFCTCGGLVVDWNLKTSLEGLYAAGMQILGGSDHSGAATTGRWAGAHAAGYAKKASEPVIDQKQIENEKSRVYAPIKREDGIDWKELGSGVTRIMQDYCGKHKNEEGLKLGLRWLKELKNDETQNVYARNPHELMRTLEVLSLISVGEIIIHASIARKASSDHLDFYRIDYPEKDPSEWHKFITTKLENGEVKIGEKPIDYWLKPPYASTYEENYEKNKPNSW